jgi:hypothetical protein
VNESVQECKLKLIGLVARDTRLDISVVIAMRPKPGTFDHSISASGGFPFPKLRGYGFSAIRRRNNYESKNRTLL